MVLDEILSHNRDYPGGTSITGEPAREIIVFACMDTRLVELLEGAMGIQRGEAMIIKNAGVFVTEDVLRSMEIAILNYDIKEIFVVGHTDCATAKIKVYDVTESMKKKGIERSAIPSGDIRGWLGACANERERVKESVNKLKESPLIPGNILIHGLLIDSNRGTIEVVERGQERETVKPIAAVSACSSEKPPAEEKKEISTLDRPIEWLQDKALEIKSDYWASAFESKFDLDSIKAAADNYGQQFGKIEDFKEQATEAWQHLDNLSKAMTDVKQELKNFSKAPVAETRKFLEESLASGLEKQVERFEVWLEDMGIFGEDVKEEIKRLTRRAVDDVSVLQKAICSTKTPQEAQKIKKQLQALGAKAFIRRVKKVIK